MTESQQLDRIFAALADPTRRAIVAKLASRGASVSELAEPFNITQPAVSKHLRILEDANLVSSTKEGQRRPRELNPESLVKALGWIDRYREIWEANFAKLDSLLEELNRPQPKIKSDRKRKQKKV